MPDYSRKKRARKKSSSSPRTNEKSENVVIKGDIERLMTLLMELMKQSAKSRSYLRQMKEMNRANSSNFLLNNSRNGSTIVILTMVTAMKISWKEILVSVATARLRKRSCSILNRQLLSNVSTHLGRVWPL